MSKKTNKKIEPVGKTGPFPQAETTPDPLIEVGILSEIPQEERKAKIKELKKDFDEQVKELKKPSKIQVIGERQVPFDSVVNSMENELELKKGIDIARKTMEENSDSIQKQVNSMVALYNIGDKKAFFFITAQEARFAMDFIKEGRGQKRDKIEFEQSVDSNIDSFFSKGAPQTNSDPYSEQISETEIRELLERTSREIEIRET